MSTAGTIVFTWMCGAGLELALRCRQSKWAPICERSYAIDPRRTCSRSRLNRPRLLMGTVILWLGCTTAPNTASAVVVATWSPLGEASFTGNGDSDALQLYAQNGFLRYSGATPSLGIPLNDIA